MNLGCSGFIYALRMASSLIESNQAKNGIIKKIIEDVVFVPMLKGVENT